MPPVLPNSMAFAQAILIAPSPSGVVSGPSAEVNHREQREDPQGEPERRRKRASIIIRAHSFEASIAIACA